MDLSGHEEDIPIPVPLNTKYVGDHGHVQNINNHPTSNGLPLPTTNKTTITTDDNQNNDGDKKKQGVVAAKYRECLKNHAASIGGNAIDGCGEFMPSGEEGTMEALQCSACTCHRNFHRKMVEGENSLELYHHNFKGRNMMGQKGVMISGSDPYGYNSTHNSLIPIPSPQYMIMPLGAMQTSESDDMEGVGGGVISRPPMMKKRYRTKFTSEQKEKMLGFAERVEWKLQKQEENVVHQFCQDIGVKRRVLKVWMHNNKHNLAKKGFPQLE